MNAKFKTKDGRMGAGRAGLIMLQEGGGVVERRAEVRRAPVSADVGRRLGDHGHVQQREQNGRCDDAVRQEAAGLSPELLQIREPEPHETRT